MPKDTYGTDIGVANAYKHPLDLLFATWPWDLLSGTNKSH